MTRPGEGSPGVEDLCFADASYDFVRLKIRLRASTPKNTSPAPAMSSKIGSGVPVKA